MPAKATLAPALDPAAPTPATPPTPASRFTVLPTPASRFSITHVADADAQAVGGEVVGLGRGPKAGSLLGSAAQAHPVPVTWPPMHSALTCLAPLGPTCRPVPCLCPAAPAGS